MNSTNSHKKARSFLEDLSDCKLSGVGTSVNTIYVNGSFKEGHVFEDCSLHCQLDNDVFFYGIFDGYRGSKVANCGLQTMAAEILLGQFIKKQSDDEIKEILRQAFISVEKDYINSIDDLLARRTCLLCEFPENDYNKYPHVYEEIKNINEELSMGAEAVIGLIFNQKLYVGNIGKCRALLCKTDDNSVLRVIQLTVDHDLRNEDELLRLTQLGIEKNRLRYGCHLGNQKNTRCIGNYMVKGCYREFPEFRVALNEPVIADSEVHGGIALDESCRFLLFTSSGLTTALEQILSSSEVNKYIAQLVVEQFRTQTSLKDVAQAALDKIISKYKSLFPENPYEDMTLVVRNFNFPLPNGTRPVKKTLSNSSECSDSSRSGTLNGPDSSAGNRIKPYVDFSQYYINLEKSKAK